MSDIILNVDANIKAAEAKIGKLGNKSINLNVKNFNQPLGKITGQLGEFEKSLEASNARVIAFGASAGAIYALQRALSETVRSAIEVQKSLADINVILNLSSASLSKFGASLFDIAKSTGNSFNTVATAATELSRQGLGVEETLKRTENALILTRLSGLQAADAVAALTAAINGFSREALTSSEIVNKFAAVDAAFAVSSADLAEAIKRVGSSASEAGVSLDELIAIVTTAQQITARGGAVIGNSFKTIFTRLQRTDVLDSLNQLGIATQTQEGNTRPLINILTDLSKTYDDLSDSQKSQIAELVGGVFQINILKASLSDLNKEYSIYSRALQISGSATNEAISRNQELNKTFSSLINQTLANLTQAGAKFGGEAFLPGIEKVLGSVNKFLADFNVEDTESLGAKVGQGFVKGLGDFLSGPGIIVGAKVLFTIFERLAVFSADALKTVLGLNAKSLEQAQIQRQIFDLLSKNPQIIAQINQGSLTVEQTQQLILKTIQQQTAAMQQQIGLAKTLASSLSQAGLSIATKGIAKGNIQAKFAGYIPNFANQNQLVENIGAAQHGYKAGKAYKKTLYDGSGGSFSAIVNSAEDISTFRNSAGKKATIVQPPNGFAKGFIPNFAKTITSDYPEKNRPSTKLGLIYAQKAPLNKDTGGVATFGGYDIPIKFQSSGFSGKRIKKPKDADLEKQLGDYIVKFTNNFANKIFEPNGQLQKSAKITSADELSNIGSFKSITGTVFETAVDLAAGKINEGRGQNAGIDFASPNQFIRNLFNGIAASQLEAKVNADPAQLNSVAQKAIQNGLISPELKKIIENLGGQYETQKKKAGQRKANVKLISKADGYIPNFAALNDAIQREKNAGINASLIKIGSDLELQSKSNPLGLGIYNTKDEPGGLKQGIRNARSSGYIPNFAQAKSKAFDPTFREQVFGAEERSIIKAEELKQPLNRLKASFITTATKTKEIGEALTTSKGKLGEMQSKLVFASFGFSLLSGQLKEFSGNSSFTRVATAASDAASTFSSIAGVIPGPIGLVAGGAAALGQTLYKVQSSIDNAGLQEIQKTFEQSRENFGKLSDATQRYISVFEGLQEATKKGDPSITAKLQAELNTTLLQIPEEYRNLIASSGSLKETQNNVSKIITQEGSKIQQQNVSAAIASVVESSYTFGDALENSADSLVIGIAKIISNNDEALDQVLKERKKKDVFAASESGATKGRGLGASLFAGLSLENQNKVIQDVINNNLKLVGTQKEVIDGLKEYGVSNENLSVLNNLTIKDLEILIKGFRDGASTIQKSSEDFSENIKKTAYELTNMSEIIKLVGDRMSQQSEYSRSLDYTQSQSSRNVGIERVKGVANINAITGDEFSKIRDQGKINQTEIYAKGQDELFNAQQKYYSTSNQLQTDFSQNLYGIQNELAKGSITQEQASAKLSEALIPYAIKQEQANEELINNQKIIANQTNEAIALDQTRNELLRNQAEILRDIAIAGGAQGYLDYNELNSLAEIDFNKRIAEDPFASKEARGRAAGRVLQETVSLTGEKNRPEYAGLEQMFTEGRAENLKSIGEALNERLSSFGAQGVTSRLTESDRYTIAARQAATITGKPLMQIEENNQGKKYQEQFLNADELKKINQQTLDQIIKGGEAQINLTTDLANSVLDLNNPINSVRETIEVGNVNLNTSLTALNNGLSSVFPNQGNIDVPLSSISSQIDNAINALSAKLDSLTSAISNSTAEQKRNNEKSSTPQANNSQVNTNVVSQISQLKSQVNNLTSSVKSTSSAVKSLGQTVNQPSIIPSASGPSSSYSPGATDMVFSRYSNVA